MFRVNFLGQSSCEKDIVKLRASVGIIGVIVFFVVDIVEINFGLSEVDIQIFMSEGADIDNSESLGFLNLVPEEMGEVEMSKVIDSPLHFDTLFGEFAPGNGHQTCVVDQQVDLLKGDALGE